MKRPGFQSTDCKEQGLLPASFWGALQQRGYQTVGEGKRDLFPEIFEIMQKNMERMSADVDWLIEKFDYQNKDADWKNSKDAIQRGMQNIRGGYPADPVYKMNK